MKKNYKYVIGYLYDDYKIKSLHTMLPKGSVYVKGYDENEMDVFIDWRWWKV